MSDGYWLGEMAKSGEEQEFKAAVKLWRSVVDGQYGVSSQQDVKCSPCPASLSAMIVAWRDSRP
jgi:hypothetical protein